MKGNILPDHLLIKLQEETEETTKSGLILVKDEKEKKLTWAEVIKIGALTDNWEGVKIKEGDTILLNRSSLQELELEGEKYHLTRINQILLIK